MEEQKLKTRIDPITGEIITELEESPEVIAEKQLFKKNPARAQALRDLMFDSLQAHIDGMNVPAEKRDEMMFILIANSVMDLIFDAPTTDIAMESSYCFDEMLGMALANKKFEVDIIAEAKKAVESVKREDFPSDEAYLEGLQAFEERWWDMGQPALGMRSPNDAIYEMLGKYKLNEE
ncbi:MAG: hypothetical protein IKC93_04580 [Candidatus Methanomethylophilaceae archaeon]|nr:hypothetical protein [Candidatus Methanomethylophilaceae archaeon]MBR7124126.1 hypothetical protein [Candidatus Methanomethylophilaceae archaeon]